MKIKAQDNPICRSEKISINDIAPEPVCPRCRSVISLKTKNNGRKHCGNCNSDYETTAGFTDLRIHSDRYLSLNQERQKAERLALYEHEKSLEGLTRRYYQMTADVSSQRRERFVRHVMTSQFRGYALLSRIPEKGSILEVGTGTGGFMAAALLSGRNATGVDIASRWLVVARKRLMEIGSNKTLPLYPACAESLPWKDNTFDHVVADSLLEHLAKPEIAILEMVRVAKPGGTVLIWSPNRYWPGVDPHVGLFGVGYLCRSWARKYVAWRRGNIHWPESRSPKDWARMVSDVLYSVEVKYRSADLSGWPILDRTLQGRFARILGRLSNIPVLSSMATRFGPVGEIRIIKKTMEKNGLAPNLNEDSR